MMGPRRDFARGAAILPNNLVLTLTGAGLLWFGWFGFNAGSSVAVENPVAGSIAGLAFATTQSAAAAAGLSWMLVERWHHGKVTSLGLASGIVAGLVAITPAAGHIKPWAALILGALLTGLFYFTPVKGLFSGGDLSQFGKQALGVGVALAFAGGGTFLIGTVLKRTMGLRTTDQEERDGLDIHVHGERGYQFDQT